MILYDPGEYGTVYPIPPCVYKDFQTIFELPERNVQEALKEPNELYHPGSKCGLFEIGVADLFPDDQLDSDQFNLILLLSLKRTADISKGYYRLVSSLPNGALMIQGLRKGSEYKGWTYTYRIRPEFLVVEKVHSS